MGETDDILLSIKQVRILSIGTDRIKQTAQAQIAHWPDQGLYCCYSSFIFGCNTAFFRFLCIFRIVMVIILGVSILRVFTGIKTFFLV